MKRSLATFLLLAVALWLPVLAIAVPLLAMRCADAGMSVPATLDDRIAHEHEGAQAGAVPDDEGPADPHGGGHFCCHHFSALAAALPIEQADAPGFVPAVVTVRAYRFFPEPVKRPPQNLLV